MTVRRLAEQQPESFAFTPENREWCAQQIAKYPEGRQSSAVLALLWRAQAQNGYWLPRPAIELVAEMLDLPFIRVLEIATFYTMFNLEPVGRHYVQICGTTPCVLAGSDAIKDVLSRRIGPAGKVTADGTFSWSEVECLGACCNAPMVQINDDYYEDLTPTNFEKLLDDLAAGRPVARGSQIGRNSSEPTGELTTLVTLYGVDGRSGPECASRTSDRRDESAAAANLAAIAPAESEPAHARAASDQAQSSGYPKRVAGTTRRRTKVPGMVGPNSERDEKDR